MPAIIKKILTAIVLIAFSINTYAIPVPPNFNIAYISNENPFGQPGTTNAINSAFNQPHEVIAPLAWNSPEVTSGNIFSNYDFIIFDGSGSGSNIGAINTYMSSNISSIESYVNTGGNVLINAANTGGGTTALPFGGAIDSNAPHNNAIPYDPTHPIMQGIIGTLASSPVALGDVLPGSTYDSITHRESPFTNSISLAELYQGSGHITITTLLIAYPNASGVPIDNTNVIQLGKNLVHHAAYGSAIPEPISLATATLALIAISTRTKRRTN